MASSGIQCEKKIRREPKESFEPPPLWDALLTYISYGIVTLFGYLADIWRRLGIKKDIAFIEPGKVREIMVVGCWLGYQMASLLVAMTTYISRPHDLYTI